MSSLRINPALRAADTCNSMHYDFEKTELYKRYMALPEAVRSLYTFKEYQWLGTERERIIERETMPDGPAE